MIKKIFINLLVFLLIFLYGEVAHDAWKWKFPRKRKTGTEKVSKDEILIKIAGKIAKLRLGANSIYITQHAFKSALFAISCLLKWFVSCLQSGPFDQSLKMSQAMLCEILHIPVITRLDHFTISVKALA